MKPLDHDEIQLIERALLRLAPEAGPIQATAHGTSIGVSGSADLFTTMYRRDGLLPSPAPEGAPHPLSQAGRKLRDLRVRSGWTVEEIADRTRFSSDLLAAFEDGDSAAADKMTVFDLERFAEACCGTLADLLGPDHPWVVAALRREERRHSRWRSIDPFDSSPGSFIDPTG